MALYEANSYNKEKLLRLINTEKANRKNCEFQYATSTTRIDHNN